jgi:MFS family permease
MTERSADGARAVSFSPLALVWMLGVTQVIGYGTVYYSFAILAADIARDFGWPVSWLYGAFSAALLAGGFAAPLTGRRIDRHGAGLVMAVGSATSALALAAMALAPGPIGFVAALIALEICSTLMLYDAAFAALVQTCGKDARLRITHLTLIAGFASTIFWPLTTWLDGRFDWRLILGLFAAINLVVCLPIHGALARATRGAAPERPTEQSPAGTAPPPAAPEAGSRRIFVLVALGFALSGMVLSAILAQMVPVLAGLGLGGSALLVSTLFGPAQVLVRFVNMVFGVRRSPLFVTILAMAMFPAAMLCLAVTAPAVAGAAVAAVLLGFGSGLKSIVQGTLPLALFGSASYGARLGSLALVRQFMAAGAPFAFAASLEGLGATVSLGLAALTGLLGVGCFLEILRLRGRSAAPPAAAPSPAATR